MSNNQTEVGNKTEISILTALQIAKEAVKQLNIPNGDVVDMQFDPSRRWTVYYRECDDDLVLSIQLNPLLTGVLLHTSLKAITFNIWVELTTILSSENAPRLFQVEDSKRDQIVYEKTLRLTKEYVLHLPTVIFHSFHQAFRESIIGHIKKFVEDDADLRKHWETIGLPQDFSLIPNKRLNDIAASFPDVELHILKGVESINEEFSAYRKAAVGNRRVWFDQEAYTKSPDDYERLRLEYKKAKKEYKPLRDAFFRVNRRAGEKDWQKHWKEFCTENFPTIFLLDEIANLSASDLAYKDLGNLYGFSVTYMDRLIRNARAQAKEQKRRQKRADIRNKNIR